MNPLDLIRFDVAGFEAQGDRNGVRVWHSPAGDGVGLYYYPIPPDIEADLEDVEAIRTFYRKTASRSGSAIIEVETPMVQKFRAVRTIVKVPQNPSGMSYLGSLTLPFRDFSYVLKVQCAERGVTGEREALILDRLIASGVVSISQEGGIEGWMEDPYDATVRAPFMRNRAEATEYDAKFPEHPLSRARQVLDGIQTTMAISPSLRSAPSFQYSAPPHHAGRWWRRW